MFKDLRTWIEFISIIAVYGKRLVSLIKELNAIYDEAKPEIKSGKEKFDTLIETMKIEIGAYWKMSNDLLDKLIEWADKRTKQIVAIYNESGLFSKVEDRIEK
jgi:hypothetical protein